MLIALSAEAVARSVMSGENLRAVIPRACARGRVTSGTKLSDLDGCAGGETERDVVLSSEEAYGPDLDLDREAERRPVRERGRSL